MSFLPGNAQHIGARSSQQDSFGFGDPGDQAFSAHGGFVAVVCDGMGGMAHGDVASRTAVRAFLDAYLQKNPAESIPEALERSVREANERVIEVAHEMGAAESVGTTLVATVLIESGLRDKSMYFISVGDSGIFHVSDGQIQTVNRSHIFANILDAAVERGAMSKEQAVLHPERESLTSFIGVEVLEEIDRNVDPWPLCDGDSILLASDGLFKTLTTAEILETTQQEHPRSWPEALVARTLAQKHEYQDNVTVVSIAVQDAPSPFIPPPPAVEWERGSGKTALRPGGIRSHKLVAVALAIGIAGIALAGGGWWYKKHRQTSVMEKK